MSLGGGSLLSSCKHIHRQKIFQNTFFSQVLKILKLVFKLIPSKNHSDGSLTLDPRAGVWDRHSQDVEQFHRSKTRPWAPPSRSHTYPVPNPGHPPSVNVNVLISEQTRRTNPTAKTRQRALPTDLLTSFLKSWVEGYWAALSSCGCFSTADRYKRVLIDCILSAPTPPPFCPETLPQPEFSVHQWPRYRFRHSHRWCRLVSPRRATMNLKWKQGNLPWTCRDGHSWGHMFTVCSSSSTVWSGARGETRSTGSD